MNINPYAKGAASGAYEQGVKTAADYAGVTTQLDASVKFVSLIHAGNYATYLPDANGATINSIYTLNYAANATAIPANLPWATYPASLASTLITTGGSYPRQILLCPEGLFYARLNNGSAWGAWLKLSPKVL